MLLVLVLLLFLFRDVECIVDGEGNSGGAQTTPTVTTVARRKRHLETIQKKNALNQKSITQVVKLMMVHIGPRTQSGLKRKDTKRMIFFFQSILL